MGKIYKIFCLILFFSILLLSTGAIYNNEKIISDSSLSFEEAIEGTKAPKNVVDSLTLLNVKYISFDGKIHSGQLIINKLVKNDIEEIFELMLEHRFPIEKVKPITVYNWSDDASMEDNNTSAFNYRNIAGTNRLSNHSFGRAIDINPLMNPVIYKDGKVSPPNGHYDIKKSGTFSAENFVVKEFVKRGWRWGGNFSQYKDNHHFDKTN